MTKPICRSNKLKWLGVMCMIIACSCQAPSTYDADTFREMETSFSAPPGSAKPWTWWHWGDGNITKQGITNDLENMKRAGLEAVLIFNVRLGLPNGQVRFMSEEWLEMLDHTTAECERLGLLLGIHNCDGWSQSGGPWITPEQSMKTLTWSTIKVEGPGTFDDILTHPPIPESPYVKDFYRDIVVLAYPTPIGERINGPGPGVSISGTLPDSELQLLIDNDHETRVGFPLGSQEDPVKHAFTMHFPEITKVRSLTIHNINGFYPAQVIPAKLEVALDGGEFKEVANFELNWAMDYPTVNSITVAFPEAVGHSFRMSFQGEHLFVNQISFTELELSSKATVNYWEAKTGWARIREHGGEAPVFARDTGPEYEQMRLVSGQAVPIEKVQVFKGSLAEDGRFEWDIPEGKWTIQRIGYTSTGKTNLPATDAGRGLEADKLDADAVRFHMEQFVGNINSRYQDKNLQAFKIFETDSWESGAQTWTSNLDARFIQSTGVDLISFLPLLTEGVIIEGYEESDRFLSGWRRFLADEIAENYYHEITNFAEENGLTYVAEASGRQMFMYDPIGYQRIVPITMGEFWADSFRGEGVRVDNRVAASAAHLTGKKYVTSEAYTSRPQSSRWNQHPFTLKALGDEAFCEGVNKMVFHTYTHQPYPELKPGFTMGQWGMHNHVGNTWWGRPVEAWYEYLSRCQYMLQEGLFHADILAYLGDDVPARLGRRDEFIPAIPAGYDYDGCDFQALLDAKVEEGTIVLPSGMRYRVLLLPDKNRMKLKEVERIAQLLKDGAVVVTPGFPKGSTDLSDMHERDHKVKTIVNNQWRGLIFERRENLEGIMRELNIPPDFTYQTEQDADIRFIHRLAEGGDMYFLSNQEERSIQLEAIFRQPSERKLSLWDPATGKKTAATLKQTEDQMLSKATITLAPYESVFAVFSDFHPELEPILSPVTEVEVDQAWTVNFPDGMGVTNSPVIMQPLIDWSKHSDFGIRHFSGTATYSTTVKMEQSMLDKGKHVMIDLGSVREMAQVVVNGEEAAMLWKPPFIANISALLQPGSNLIEIHITNLWANRLIGDAHFPEENEWRGIIIKEWPDWLLEGKPRPPSERITWTTRGKIYDKDDSLLPSGLLGPVKLIYAQEVD